MKKLFVITLLLGFLIGAFAAWNARGKPAALSGNAPVSAINLFPAPTPLIVPVPVRLMIPKLNINASIESVGQDGDGRMAAPSDWFVTGWYMYGPKPGERGQAVIAGHYDTPTGPSTFYKLNELQPGDEIVVIDQKGGRHIFSVFDTAVYSDAAFPAAVIFGQSREHRLNLVTCEGVFDRQSKNYSDRLVVYAKLVN